MKRILLVAAAALMLLKTLVVPTVLHADGGVGGINCGGSSICKPLFSHSVTKTGHGSASYCRLQQVAV